MQAKRQCDRGLIGCSTWKTKSNGVAIPYSETGGYSACAIKTTPLQGQGTLKLRIAHRRGTAMLSLTGGESRKVLRRVLRMVFLVAPYCAIARDYLSDGPLLRAMGFLVSQHDQWGAIPRPPFLILSTLESIRSGGAIPPHKSGISAILARYPMKTRQNACDATKTLWRWKS